VATAETDWSKTSRFNSLNLKVIVGQSIRRWILWEDKAACVHTFFTIVIEELLLAFPDYLYMKKKK
jgi:hypothetical protein